MSVEFSPECWGFVSMSVEYSPECWGFYACYPRAVFSVGRHAFRCPTEPLGRLYSLLRWCSGPSGKTWTCRYRRAPPAAAVNPTQEYTRHHTQKPLCHKQFTWSPPVESPRVSHGESLPTKILTQPTPVLNMKRQPSINILRHTDHGPVLIPPTGGMGESYLMMHWTRGEEPLVRRRTGREGVGLLPAYPSASWDRHPCRCEQNDTLANKPLGSFHAERLRKRNISLMFSVH